jgi:hypothetical protein
VAALRSIVGWPADVYTTAWALNVDVDGGCLSFLMLLAFLARSGVRKRCANELTDLAHTLAPLVQQTKAQAVLSGKMRDECTGLLALIQYLGFVFSAEALWGFSGIGLGGFHVHLSWMNAMLRAQSDENKMGSPDAYGGAYWQAATSLWLLAVSLAR